MVACLKCARCWGPWLDAGRAAVFCSEHAATHLQDEKNDRRREPWDEARRAKQREYNRAYKDRRRKAAPSDPGISDEFVTFGMPFAPGNNRRRK